MLTRRPPRPVLLGACVLVVAVVALVVTRDGDDGGPSADQVRAVPVETLTDGSTVELGEVLGGRPVVLNFFGRWCIPCREEMPAFEAVHQALGDEVTFVGIATGEKPELSLRMVEETGVTYPTFTDQTGDAVSLFDAVLLPTTVFIDADGNVVASEVREFDEAGLRDAIADRLGVEAPAS